MKKFLTYGSLVRTSSGASCSRALQPFEVPDYAHELIFEPPTNRVITQSHFKNFFDAIILIYFKVLGFHINLEPLIKQLKFLFIEVLRKKRRLEIKI